MAVDIDELQIEIQSSATSAVSNVDALTNALVRLRSSAKGGAGLTATVNQMKALASASAAISSVNIDGGKFQQIASALSSLSSVEKATGLTSTINALKKLPAITDSLKNMNIAEFATQITRVADAVRPLAAEMQKVSAGFAAFPIRIQKIISSNAGLPAANHTAAKSFGVLGTGISSTFVKLGAYYYAFKRVANIMGGWVQKSNDYVENLNLFTVAMGSGAKEALNYAEKVRDALGIDVSEFIRNQGIFKQITSGFGVVEEKANLMSKNLTQLGYDISSFFNRPIEEAMQKVQSGIAGELEPLRRHGYALDVATLQEIAYKHGIDKKVNAMNQAQKSQLRYIAIMEQSNRMGLMGDMARTILTPANAMRILNQQITQLCRAIGNLMIPFLIKVIPYVQAFVRVLTGAMQTLANLVGFKLPEIDYEGLGEIGTGAENADDALSGAAGSAKELKNAMMGIDELNILAPTSGGGGGGGVIGGGDLGVDLPEYDFLKELDSKTDEIFKKIKSWFDEFKENPAFKAMGGALEFMWTKAIKPLGAWLDKHPTVLNVLLTFLGGLAAMTAVAGVAKVISKAIGLTGLAGGIADLGGGIAKWLKPKDDGGISDIASGMGELKKSVGGLFDTFGGKETPDFSAMFENMKSAFSGKNEDYNSLLDAIGDAGHSMAKRLVGGISEALPTELDKSWSGIANKIKKSGESLSDGLLSGANGGIAGKKVEWEKWAAKPNDIFRGENGIHSPSTVFEENGKNIMNGLLNGLAGHDVEFKAAFQGVADQFKAVFSETKAWWDTGLLNWWNLSVTVWFVPSKWKELARQAINEIGSAFDTWATSSWDGSVSGWWNANVAPWFKNEKWDELAKEAFPRIGTAFVNWKNDTWIGAVQTWWDDNVAPWFNTETWGKMAKAAWDAVSGALGKSVKVPIDLSIQGSGGFGGGHSGGGGAGRDIRGFTTGGFPEQGQYFRARENGPELVGTIGNRTAVANNDQIVDGISGGVAEGNIDLINAVYAMASRIVKAVEEKDSNVYLDKVRLSRTLVPEQKRRERETGRSFVTGGAL